MTLYRDKEDGQLVVGYPKMDRSRYTIPSHREVLEVIDEAPAWDSIDPEIYKAFCDEFNLDYDDFDDPDEMFQALSSAVEKEEKNEENN